MMRIIKTITLILTLISCVQSEKGKVVNLDKLDKEIINESIDIIKIISEKDSISISGIIRGNEKLTNIHSRAVWQVDTFSFDKKNYIVSLILENQNYNALINQNDLLLKDVFIENDINRKLIVSPIVYGRFHKVNFASIVIYWEESLDGYYFYFEEYEKGLYTPIIFGEVDLNGSAN